MYWCKARATIMGIGLLSLWLTGARCPGSGERSSNSSPTGRASDAQRIYPLDSLPTDTITVRQQSIRVWVVQEFDEKRPGVVQEGLMHVPASEIADNQGMLFVFSDERLLSFWMKNTITPLDIAFARIDGTIVQTWQMPPLTLDTFPSIEPAIFALEMKAGAFARIGIQSGDRMSIPDQVFKAYP